MQQPARLERLECFLQSVNHRPRLWLTLMALFLALQISPWWYPTGDGCSYLSMARSIAQDEEPAHLGNPGLVTAPVYPIVISPAFLLNDRPFLVLSVIQWFMAVLLMLGIYRWSSRRFPSLAILITAFVVVNIGVLAYYRRTLKEIAFMVILVWTVNLLQNVLEKKPLKKTVLATVFAAAAMMLLVCTRYAGIVLAPAFGIAALVEVYRSRMSLIRAVTLTLSVGVPASILLLGWIYYDKYHSTGGGAQLKVVMSAYSGELPDSSGSSSSKQRPKAVRSEEKTEEAFTFITPDNWAERIAVGLQLRMSDSGRLMIPGMWKASPRPGEWLSPYTFIYLVFGVVLAVGWWRIVRRQTDVFALALPFYLFLYAHWPYDQYGRYMVAMLPLLMACAWFGMRSLVRRPLSLAVLLVAAHLGQAAGYWLWIDAPRAWAAHRYWPEVDRVISAMQTEFEQTAPEYVVGVVGVPRATHAMLCLASDRYVIPFVQNGPNEGLTNWVILPKDAPTDYEGWVLQQVIDDYKVLRKEDSQEAELRDRLAAGTDPQGAEARQPEDPEVVKR